MAPHISNAPIGGNNDLEDLLAIKKPALVSSTVRDTVLPVSDAPQTTVVQPTPADGSAARELVSPSTPNLPEKVGDLTETDSATLETKSLDACLDVEIAIAVEIDEVQNESSASDSEDDEATKKRNKKDIRKWARSRRKQKLLTEQVAKNVFVKSHGIIYVADAKWNHCREAADNCHLFVSSSALDTKSSMNLEDLRSKELGPPSRFRIVNVLLSAEMLKLSGASRLNQDHVMPYRSIIPNESKYRQRLEELESQFTKMSQDKPNHSTVQVKPETHYFIPTHHCYGVIDSNLKTYVTVPPALDDMEQTRILLDGFRSLVHFLDTDLRELVKDYHQIQANTIEKLPFSHLWYLFSPGQEILTRQPKHQVYRVLQVIGGRKCLHRSEEKRFQQRTISDLVIDCFHVEFDGNDFNPVANVLRIKAYDGTRPITSLPVYPLALAKPLSAPAGEAPERSLPTILTGRGRKYEQLSKTSYRRYKGLTLHEKGLFDTLEEIEGDIIIDFQLAYRNKIPNKTFGDGILEVPTDEDGDEIGDGEGVNYDDPDALRQYWTSWSFDNPLLQPQSIGELHAESYKLLPATVYGYALLSRKWYPLDIDLVSEVPERKPGEDDGFDKLVLPIGHKDIVRALVKTHARKLEPSEASGTSTTHSVREFDVVKGKGRGLIILLHGAPGVGKTSTAECVAANVGKPLFPITCGDIGGETAQEVENNLDKFFDLARKWDCVLLLDEADVFLCAREDGNIRQSSLVSVFLRVLEYYSGILILTTNRVGSFDEAIKSRVHCALYYPLLDKAQTFKIWQMNLKSLDERNFNLDPKLKIRFDHREIEDFAKSHWKNGNSSNRWNGRQIKNAFQTAVALADWENMEHQGASGPILRSDNFKKVAEASEHFDIYLKKTRLSDQYNARAKLQRNDDNNGNDESESDSEHDARRKSKRRSESKKKVQSGNHKSDTRRSKRRAEASSEVEDLSGEGDSEDQSSSGGSQVVSESGEEELPPAPPVKAAKLSKKKRTKD